jgi:[ribosomal protein S18]-alanine N-acetyltransferase
VSIRPLESRDVEAIMAIQNACPEIAQWKSADYERVPQGEMLGWVFELDGVLIGFLVARLVQSEFEILNFAVSSGARRQGTGAALLGHALTHARSFAAEQAILEVRSANQAAVGFYMHHKFQIVGRRRNYYNAPPDAALLLTLRLI